MRRRIIRIDNKPKFVAFKHKNFSLKVLKRSVKNLSDVPDIEEAENLI